MTSIQNWFDDLKVSESDNSDFKSALLDLLANGHDSSYYINTLHIIPNNLGFIQKDSRGKYFVETTIPVNPNDILQGFQIYPRDNATLELNINDQLVPLNCYLIIPICCAMYTELKLRVTFTEEPFEFKVKYRCYVLQTDLRQSLRKKDIVQNGLRYRDGMVTVI